jgi:DNA-binding CsgD family transcriptional regulator
MRGHIAGRDAELASVREFVASVSDGAAALVLQGEAGVGKTTVWAAAAAEAEEGGVLVLQARPAEGETALSFSGIRDLLDPVLGEVLDPLPELQRRALSHALVLEPAEDAAAADRHAIGVAVLSVLRGLAETRPVLLAVDDVQWLDAESTAALAYAGRRLRGERVGLLLTRRGTVESALVDELSGALPAGGYRELDVGTLAPAALHAVVLEHLEVSLPAPLLAEVHEASGGNPFYALEIVRTLRRDGVVVEAGRPLPVPTSLHELVHGRLLALSPESRDFLLAAAADPNAATVLVEAASGVMRDVGLVPALEAGVVELDGDRIRFAHPLLAAGVYELAEPARRAEIHARLADLVDDPEARGRHLAVSVTEPNRAVAVALDEAAQRALARGAPRAAALLLERACALTPPDDELAAARRALDAASAHHEAGDTARARGLLETELKRLPAGNERARALFGLGRVRSYDDDLRGAAALFEQAAAVAEPGTVAQALAREGLGGILFRLRERLADAVELSERAAEAARVHGEEVLLAETLATKAVAEAALGRPQAAVTAKEAMSLQYQCLDRPILRQPRFAVGVVRFWHDDLVGARREYQEMAALAAELGDESSLPYVRVMLGQIDCALGRFEDARGETDAGLTIAEHAGQRTLRAYLLAVRAVAQAHLGAGGAEATAAQALELAGRTAGIPAWIFASWALGQLALARGDVSTALETLEPLRAHHRREAIEEPGALPFLPDGIEALLEAGRLAEAGEALDGYQATAERLGRQRGIAAARRCRGLLAAATEDLGAALVELEAALLLASRNDTPFEHARTLVALGATQRRAKRRREARETLESALAAFERLGTPLWAERARAELRRVSGRAPTQGALTPAESRIAALVAEGKTNREVAAALFLSERTVEGHLSRVYGKLGVRSRTELARELAARQQQPRPTPTS